VFATETARCKTVESLCRDFSHVRSEPDISWPPHMAAALSDSLLSLRSMTRASDDFLSNVKDEPRLRLARAVRQHGS